MTDSTTSNGPGEESDEHLLELPDGEEVPIAMVDKVFPTISRIDSEVRISIEEGRILMREDSECELSVGTGNNDIDDPSPLASIQATVDDAGPDEDTYAEFTLDDAEQVRELRDALTTILRYHEATEQ